MEPSTSSVIGKKSFCASNLTVDGVNKIVQNCESEQSDIEHSNSESYLDTDRGPEVDRYEIGDIAVVRCLAKQKKISSKNLLLSKLRWNNNTNFIPTVHEFDASGSGVRPGISTEDSTEADYFKTMLFDHIVDVLTTEANKYAH
jgi:hypothetical protein